MKQKDIAVIVAVTLFAAIASFFVANKLFVTPKTRQQTAPVVDVINSSMASPDKRFFNSDSINPTRNSSATGTNQTPFNGSGQ
jgi:hypothetical protein